MAIESLERRGGSILATLIPRDTADLLFGIQILGGFGLIVPMMVRNWTNVEGVSLSFFLVLLVFCGLQLSLAVSAYKAAPSRRASQACLVYGMWIVLQSLHILVILSRGMYIWDRNDKITIIVTVVSALLVYFLRRASGSNFEDPITKSQVGMATRGIPQLMQGWKIFLVGGAGVHGFSVLVGNLNIWIRMWHLVLTKGEASWDHNRVWMLATEMVNAFSWGLVSLIWLAWRVGWINP